jgi:Xaa-Pro aminopeptidase
VHQVFDGILSWEDAKRISGVDEVLSRAGAEDLLRTLAKKYDTVYTLGTDPHAKHYDFVLNPAQKEMQKRLKKIFSKVCYCRPDLAKLRAIKQPHEIAAMKKAIGLTVGTFAEVKRKLPSLSFEYEVEAEFTYNFGKNGGIGHAYDPIVASGKNACTLHYNSNKDRLKEGELILIDIGARVDGYAADITRTYAIGKPTKRQIAVHQAVETAHKAIISLLRPGLSVVDYQAQVDTIMQDALMSLNLLKDRNDQATYRKYFPHAISHGLGIDVHDSLGRPTELRSGMVLTVEPGIYIPEEAIGVRIEDDILITDDGNVNLSGALDTSL